MANHVKTGAIVAAAVKLLCRIPGDAQQNSGSRQADQSQAQQGQPADQAQQPVFRAGISYVRVDVIVSDKAGSPVGDLKQADFEVTEDGKPQTIENFKLIKLDGG